MLRTINNPEKKIVVVWFISTILPPGRRPADDAAFECAYCHEDSSFLGICLFSSCACIFSGSPGPLSTVA